MEKTIKMVSLILGGGQGSRLSPLTKDRSKPAVPIAGKYRLIDIPISNCIHSGVRRIFVLTQFNSASLNQHIKNTYQFDHFSRGFVDIIAAEQTPDNPRKIMLRGDTSVDYGSMMKVMGELNRAGLNSVNMVTQGAFAPSPVSQNPVSEGSATDE